MIPALVLTPLIGSLALLGVRMPDRVAVRCGLLISGLTLLLGLGAAYLTGDRGFGRTQLEFRADWVPALGLQVRLGLDGVSAPLVLLTALLTVLVCAHLLRADPPRARLLVACVLAVTGGALATFTALDLLLFFIAFETVLIPMWLIVRIWGDTPGNRDAAARFVLYTALGSALMLLGVILVVVRAGTSDLAALAAADLPAGTQTVAAVLIVLGLAVKTPIWPLHTWLPPAHTTAPTAGSVLLAGILLKLGSYGLIRVVVPVLPDGLARVAPWLGGFAVAGVVAAGLACLGERDLKRLVAQSSVAHMGFVLLGVASATPVGLQGALYANVAHGVVSALLFLVVGALKDRYHSADLLVLGPGLRDRLPRLGGLLALGAVAGLGLPGLAVFWGELLAIAGAWQSEALGLTARPLAVVAALGTVVAAAYWLRVLRLLWQGSPAPAPPSATPSSAASEPARSPSDVPDATAHEIAVTLPLVLATVGLGLVPGPLLAATVDVVGRILPGGGAAP